MAQRLTESEIRARLFRIHGTKLRLKAYGGALRKKSSFDCNECGLVWETTTSGPVYLRSGCPRCAGSLVTEEEVRARLQETHEGQVEMLAYGGGRFKYSDFKCKVCEHEWEAFPQNTVYKGSGCPKCAGNAKLSPEEVRARIRAEHGDDVEMTEYGGNAQSHSQFLCKVCDHSWSTKTQNVYDVRCGATGCAACSTTGLDPTAPTSLYYMRVAGEQDAVFFKVGITNALDPMQRFRREPKGRVEHLRSWRFDTGQNAYEVEQFALKSFSPLNAGFTQDEGPLRSKGNTELFTVDFLQDLERMVDVLSTPTTNPISGDSPEQCQTETLRLRTGTELLNRPQTAV